jgi:hypothetical protein
VAAQLLVSRVVLSSIELVLGSYKSRGDKDWIGLYQVYQRLQDTTSSFICIMKFLNISTSPYPSNLVHTARVAI